MPPRNTLRKRSTAPPFPARAQLFLLVSLVIVALGSLVLQTLAEPIPIRRNKGLLGVTSRLETRQVAQGAELFVGELDVDVDADEDEEGEEQADEQAPKVDDVDANQDDGDGDSVESGSADAPADQHTETETTDYSSRSSTSTSTQDQDEQPSGIDLKLAANPDFPPLTPNNLLRAAKKKTTTRRKLLPVVKTKAGVVSCPTYPVSWDGSCGAGVGKSCPPGTCCSAGGFCGTGDPWCGAGCQLGYGLCNAGTGCAPAPPAVIPTTARPAIIKTTSRKPVVPTTPLKIPTSPAGIKQTTPIPKKTTAAPPLPVKTTPAPNSGCPSYPVSTDGMCGTANGQACPAPYCCSATGFCGLGDPWCGTGCQNGFGVCYQGSCSGGPGPQPTALPSTFTPNGTPIPTRTRTTLTTINIDPGKVPRFPVQKEVGSYFTQWGVYARGFKMSKIAQMAAANEITFINYAFGNIYQKNGGYECGIINAMESGTGTGGDAWSDFGMTYTTSDSVDGQADTWDQPLAGSFNQLRKLKAKYPKIRAFISIGGWTWSRWFSAASATAELRSQLVSSCIDVYIKGNLPLVDGKGGPGSAAGVFDGIDIDWEYPGGGGLDYNTFSVADKENFSKLLAEFRYQLSLMSMTTGKAYGLSVAIGAGRDKIMMTDPAIYSQYLDWVNIMSYDFRGAWVPTGPANFHANLIGDPNTPDFNRPLTGILPGANRYYNVKDSVEYWLAQGGPANKLVLGIPFYGRGWTGVSPGPNGNGLYQLATGPAPGTYEAGIEDYKVLKNAPGKIYYHDVTQTSFKYDNATKIWFSYDGPADVDRKVAFAANKGLRGVFSWSLDGDTADGELLSRCALVKNRK